MNGVACNGSARKDGNTALLVNTVFKEQKKQGSRPKWYSSPAKKSVDVLPAENAMRIRITGAILPTMSSTSASKRRLNMRGFGAGEVRNKNVRVRHEGCYFQGGDRDTGTREKSRGTGIVILFNHTVGCTDISVTGQELFTFRPANYPVCRSWRENSST
jgi:hypothetical protein